MNWNNVRWSDQNEVNMTRRIFNCSAFSDKKQSPVPTIVTFSMFKSAKPVLKILHLQKPKASCSAFVFFAKDHRKRLQEEFPDDSFQDLSTKLGEAWKSLPADEREYYEELSLIDKCRFKEEKRVYRHLIYQQLSNALQNGSVSPDQVSLDILPPLKHPRASFVFFCRHMRPMLRLQADGEKSSFVKPLSVMWNSLNNQQRIPFNQLAEEDLQRAREERILDQEIRTAIATT
jgi:hypothetical protein